MGRLKKFDAAVEALADRMQLPEDALLGAARLTIIGKKTVFVENHRGLLEYGTERIRIGTLHGGVIISGTELDLTAMNKSELLLRGKILSVEWE